MAHLQGPICGLPLAWQAAFWEYPNFTSRGCTCNIEKLNSAILWRSLTVETACKLVCEGQLASIRQQTALHRATADLQFGATFAAVMGKISVTALKLAFKQYKQRQVAGECSGNFPSTHGIPCKHLLRNSSPLACEDFHQHWWLVQPACAVTLLEANNNESIYQI